MENCLICSDKSVRFEDINVSKIEVICDDIRDLSDLCEFKSNSLLTRRERLKSALYLRLKKRKVF